MGPKRLRTPIAPADAMKTLNRKLAIGCLLGASGSVLFVGFGEWGWKLREHEAVARTKSSVAQSSRRLQEPDAPPSWQLRSPAELAKDFDDLLRRHDLGEENSFIWSGRLKGCLLSVWSALLKHGCGRIRLPKTFLLSGDLQLDSPTSPSPEVRLPAKMVWQPVGRVMIWPPPSAGMPPRKSAEKVDRR